MPSQEFLDHLLETSRIQAKNIDKMVYAIEDLNDRVDKRPTSSKLLRISTAVILVLVLVFSSLVYLSYSSSNSALGEIRSCTVPAGECSQRLLEQQTRLIGNIVCNQEKSLYYLYHADGYAPLQSCALFINNEIDRLDGSLPGVPGYLEVNNDIPQYGIGVLG